MSNLVRTPVVDSRGRNTFVWKREQHEGSRRTLSTPALSSEKLANADTESVYEFKGGYRAVVTDGQNGFDVAITAPELNVGDYVDVGELIVANIDFENDAAISSESERIVNRNQALIAHTFGRELARDSVFESVEVDTDDGAFVPTFHGVAPDDVNKDSIGALLPETAIGQERGAALAKSLESTLKCAVEFEDWNTSSLENVASGSKNETMLRALVFDARVTGDDTQEPGMRVVIQRALIDNDSLPADALDYLAQNTREEGVQLMAIESGRLSYLALQKIRSRATFPGVSDYIDELSNDEIMNAFRA